MTRPLRSVLIGDVDHYPSEYAFGVNQAMTRAGHWHSSVNIRQDIGTIAKRVAEVQPDVIWGHMLLWAPGPQKTPDLLDLCVDWRERGTKVLIHDGDARTETRFQVNISPAVDLALCNHKADRREWCIEQLHWPYFAFDQDQMADPDPAYACDLLFAGRLAGGIYQARTDLVMALKAKLGDRMRVFDGGPGQHTLFRTAVLAASAKCVLGFGRPGSNGWLDVRVFQYPGAGGILLHDDVQGWLQAGEHYLSYRAGDVDDILNAVEDVAGKEPMAGLWSTLRHRAFIYVQEHHSATARVRQALAAVGLTL